MAGIQRLARNYSIYFVAYLFQVLASAISLPIWTKVLTTSEYGLFALCNVTISFAVIASRLGLQHSALRFFSDVKAHKAEVDLRGYYSTLVIGGLLLSTTISGLLVLGAGAVSKLTARPGLLALAVPLGIVVVVQTTNNMLGEFLRANLRVKLHALILASRRYLRLGSALLLVLLLGAQVKNILWGWIGAGTLMLALLLIPLLRTGNVSFGDVSPAFFRTALAFGFPLIWVEVANETLSMGDRYLLAFFEGKEVVGIYSVGYRAALLGQACLDAPLRVAIVPMYLSIWNRQGEQRTREFLGDALRYYFMLALPIAVGFTWFRTELITLLTQPRYAQAADVVPFLAFPLALYGAFFVFGAGIQIKKKTKVLMYWSAAGAGLNILLNLAFIPVWGMMGAAYATCVTYFCLTAAIFLHARRFLHVPVSVASIIKFAAVSVVAVYLASSVPGVDHVLAQIALTIPIYFAIALAVDGGLRGHARQLLHRLRDKPDRSRGGS